MLQALSDHWLPLHLPFSGSTCMLISWPLV